MRTFTLMVSDYVNTVLISQVAQTLSATAPNVTLEVLAHSSEPWESLSRGKTDFLIMPPSYLSADSRRVETNTMGFYGVPQAVLGANRIATVQRTPADYYMKLLPIKILQHSFELPTLLECLQWNRFADSDPGMM